MKKAVKIIIKTAVILVSVAAIAAAAYFGWKKLAFIKIEEKRISVSNQIEKVAELTVYKNTYSDIVSIKKSAAAGLAKSYSIVKYTGVIRAGIKDASRIKLDFSEDGKTIKALIPHSEIIGNGIIEQEVFDEKQNIFVPITTQEIFTEIEKGMEFSEERIIHSGFLTEADVRAKELVTTFLMAAGYQNVIVDLY